MKLLETWQIREALEYAGEPRDEQSVEHLSRALNYFNLSNNNLRCRWSYGTNGSGEYQSELETECLRPGKREVAESVNPMVEACRDFGTQLPAGPLLYCDEHADRLERKQSVAGMEEL